MLVSPSTLCIVVTAGALLNTSEKVCSNSLMSENFDRGRFVSWLPDMQSNHRCM
jgi:hypothetical protein